MSILDTIKKRRSIRKYKDKQVAWGHILELLEAGQFAPSAGNVQNWKCVVIRKEATRQKIANACHQQEWIQDAPVHIVIVAEPRKAADFYGERGETFYTVQGCAAVIQNMMLTATDIGLGTCWIGAFDDHQMESILGLPETAVVQGLLTLGYPDEQPVTPVRKELHTVTFTEGWGSKGYGDKAKGYQSAAWKEAADDINTKVKKIVKKIKRKKKK